VTITISHQSALRRGAASSDGARGNRVSRADLSSIRDPRLHRVIVDA
jgi:hypothetical protein